MVTHQYAIRMPNGKLYSSKSGYSIFGQSVIAKVFVWDDPGAAAEQLDQLRDAAQAIGVDDWLGVVVQRVCSEFSTADPVEEFASEIEKWAAEQ